MTEYQVQATSVPPVIRLIEGALYVELIFGAQTFRAPIGDGRFFFSQVVEKLVDPALSAAYPQTTFQRHGISALDAAAAANLLSQAVKTEGTDEKGVPFTHYDIASPND